MPRPHWRPAAAAAALLLAGCADPTEPPRDGGPSFSVDERVASAYTGFGLKLFREVAEEAGDRNVFLSPTSVAFALAMTQNAADGETRDAVAQVLETAGLSLEEVNAANRAWMEALSMPGKGVELSVANSLWARQGLPLLPDFVARVQQSYDARAETLDFDDPAASATINAWVRESTRGRIPDIVPARIDPRTVLYLINAVYFKGDWTTPFDSRQTSEAPWHLPGGGTRSVPLMRRTGEFPLLHGDGFTGVRLPYGAGRFAMYILLPDEDLGVAGLRARLTPERWAEWRAGFQPQRAMVAVPRFRLEYEVGLVPALRALGMDVAFDPMRADFGGMLAQGDAFVSDVKHKTFLEVNERGTEAAGATSVGIGVTSMPPSVVVDRPFLLAIHDDWSETVLFLGQIVDPT